MATCEKCWADAYSLEGDQVKRYTKLWLERGKAGKPCTPKERAGQWWDEDLQRDSRYHYDK